jgi:hypothetical protein
MKLENAPNQKMPKKWQKKKKKETNVQIGKSHSCSQISRSLKHLAFFTSHVKICLL